MNKDKEYLEGLQMIVKEWDEVIKIKVFEFEVKDLRTGENEYILFNISIYQDQFFAHHEALTQTQEDSNKVAYCSIMIDPDLCLDVNLQGLRDECISAINESEFFELV